MDLIIKFILSFFGCLIGTYIFDLVIYRGSRFAHKTNWTISFAVAVSSLVLNLIYQC